MIPISKDWFDQEEQAGPILSLLATRSFDLVFLFDTPSTHKVTQETKDAICRLHRHSYDFHDRYLISDLMGIRFAERV